MATKPPVVVGVSLTEASPYVIKKVTALAGDPARIIAVHVLEHTPLAFADDIAGSAEKVYLQLAEEAKQGMRALCEPFGITRTEVVEGLPAAVLHDIAEKNEASVIAVGSHGYSGWRALLGETANTVLHDARNNVLAVMIPDDSKPVRLDYRKILVAVDMTDQAHEVLEAAVRVKERFNAEMTIMTVIKPLAQYSVAVSNVPMADINYAAFMTDAKKQCSEQLTALATKYGADQTLVRSGGIATEIHKAAEERDIDLVVLGAHGTHGLALLLGSTPNAVLHGMNCDVFAVRVGVGSQQL